MPKDERYVSYRTSLRRAKKRRLQDLDSDNSDVCLLFGGAIGNPEDGKSEEGEAGSCAEGSQAQDVGGIPETEESHLEAAEFEEPFQHNYYTEYSEEEEESVDLLDQLMVDNENEEAKESGDLHDELTVNSSSAAGDDYGNEESVPSSLPCSERNDLTNEHDNFNSTSFDLNCNNLDTPLQLREGMKAKDIFIIALALSVRHSWNYEEILDYLQSQNALIDVPCLPSNKEKLFSVLRQHASEITYHAYCPHCRQYLGLKEKLPIQTKCTNQICAIVSLKSKLKYFVTLDLKSQLERFLSIPGIAEKLKYPITRNKHHPNSIQDIFDGSEYKRLVNEGIISENDLTYVFNTDGVKYLKGPKGSAWPLYIRINELRPSLRQKYLFLAGVWVDTVEPEMNVFLKPFVDQANILSANGVSWKPDGVSIVVSKIVPLCQCVDSKARYKLYNMTQFNAKEGGCTFCNAKTVNGKYPVLSPHDQPVPLLRTDQKVKDQMVEAQCSGTTIEGIKGVSALMNLDHFNLMSGQGLDDLHAAYEGCAKHHTDLLMKVKGQTSLKVRRLVVNRRLGKVKFPSKISRTEFDISRRKSWKGSMWRTWLLFCGTVCLQGLIPDKLLTHFALLSYAVFLISQDEIMSEDLPVINEYLTKYVKLFQKYYGLEHMYYNVHLMLHFHDCVMRLGPSFAYSTFGFESWNRKCITLQVHSPQGVVDQIAHRNIIRTLVNVALYLDLDVAPHIKDQLRKILSSTNRDVKFQVGETYFLGVEEEKTCTVEQIEVLERERYPGVVSFYSYRKVFFRSVLYSAAGSATRVAVDDSEVYTWKDTFASVAFFVRFEFEGQQIAGAFLHEHHVYPLQPARHIVKVGSEEALLHFEVMDTIRSPVVSIKLSQSDHFLVPMSNCHEID
ncbi:ATP phosphoribosyltransferase [Frankliniella fusca]|uniref:ATP phosphoribosyltransferase n=1 Tax=Frankliniella fusca TaxID=407009 RepID=A0AAE1HPI9_9NEOP|nr:ATP phosphoribosyltransferase [Frankliniella fusca]